MFETPLSYLFPLVPLATRFCLAFYWDWLMRDVLPEEAQERDVQRGSILGLAGFSFTAVAGLAILDASQRPGLQLSIWYVLLSFVSYVTALNLQSYKSTRWQNYLAAALIEVGSLSLTLTLVSLVFSAKFEAWFQYLVSLVAIGSWLVDHIVRLALDNSYFKGLDDRRRKEE